MPTLPTDTQLIAIGPGVLRELPAAWSRYFQGRPPLIVADENTWAAAGQQVHELLSAYAPASLIFTANTPLYADTPGVQRIQDALARPDLTAIAVGAGTINDMVKLAAHRAGRPYLIVATAASMDGYTAFGASISHEGSKQTIDCAAPRVLIADMNLIAAAPSHLAPTGYADLLAKITAGADWILADALGLHPMNQQAWELAQGSLRQSLSQPEKVRQNDPAALELLMHGLINSGLAMQVTRDSRPASGAEHQFSHLWDMENHRHLGQPVPHGSKVAIGTLVATAFYQALLDLPLEKMDVDSLCAHWPARDSFLRRLASLHSVDAVRQKALLETAAKFPSPEILRDRLTRLRTLWPDLAQRLRRQLLPLAEIRDLLDRVGAPTTSTAIGISAQRLRQSRLLAWSLRRRYTVLDLALETGHFERLASALQ
jgi:glycerol-1-phosphate dehydrogenase [NAD(P)+]